MVSPKIPARISPCPIIEAVAEIKFDSDTDPDAIYGIIYQSLIKVFPRVEKLPILQLPQQIRVRDPNLKEQPYYKFSRDNYNFMIGPGVISIGNVNSYNGWTQYRKEILSTLSLVEVTGIIKKIRRFGIRYINFFQEMDIYQNIDLGLTLRGASFEGHNKFIRLLIPRTNVTNLLQVGNKTTIQVSGKPKAGSIIDIDTFIEGDHPYLKDFSIRFPELLDHAHDEEKILFFDLLRPSFLATLNPEY